MHVRRGHPSVRLDAEALTLVAPALPQSALYYVRGPGDDYLIVSSRLEMLARIAPCAPIDTRRLVSIIYSWAGAEAPDRRATAFSGICRLLPSEILVASAEGIHAERTLPRIGRQYRPGRAADLAVELRDRLDAAVGRAIGSATSVVVLASGGLDSSGLLALAAARCRGANSRDLRAVSLQFEGPGDDRPYFAHLVTSLGVDAVRVSASDAAKWFRQSLCADAQPGCGGSATCIGMLLSATVASLGADVALCGSAGDGICGGPLPFAQLAQRGHVIAALNAALRLRGPWSLTPWGRVRSLVLRPFLPRAIVRARRHRIDRAPWMTTRFRAVLRQCREAVDRIARRHLPDTPDEWIEELCEGGDWLLPNLADIGGQALAVTHAAPFDVFKDLEFVRFMLEIDPVLLSFGHEYRGLYRLAMKGILPERIRTRQDKAYQAPAVAAAALAADALETLRDLSSLDALATVGLVDPAPFRPMFETWLSTVRLGERPDDQPGDECWEQVWQLLSVEAFLREHGRGRDLA
jgi:asparagine synthase (glutamine-hydrolysing)